MDLSRSTVLSGKNLTRTWRCILALVMFMWIVGGENVLVQAAVRETKEVNFPIRQGVFQSDSASDSSNGLPGERGEEVDHSLTTGQHSEESRKLTTNSRTRGKQNFNVKELANGDDDAALMWFEERLYESQDGLGEDVGTVGKRPWFQSWSGKRRRAVRSVGNIHKRTANRGLKNRALKELSDNEEKTSKMYERDISETLNTSPLVDPASTQRFNGERWRLLNDEKISREYPTRYPQQIIKSYDYLNSPRGKETIFGSSKYFSLFPYYFNLPNFQLTQDEDIEDDGKNLSHNFPSNQKKSAQRVSPESDRTSDHQNRLPHEVAKPKSYPSDNNNFGTQMNTFDDIKLKNSTMREWVARQEGREVLLRTFKSLYNQMSNTPGTPKKTSVKRPLNNVDSDDAGRNLQPKWSKPRAYWTHKKRPAFHSWGGKKRNADIKLSSLPALGSEQYDKPSKPKVMFQVLPSRSKRSTLSFKFNRNQGHANPQSTSAKLETGETNHGDNFKSVGAFPIRKNINVGESDVISTNSDSSPSLSKFQRNPLKNNSESITSKTTANGQVVDTDPVRTIRSSSENHPISQRPLPTHQHEGRRPTFDSLSIRRGKRESLGVFDDVTQPDLPSDIRLLTELQQKDGGNSASKEITPLDTNENSAESEAPSPRFVFPIPKLGEELSDNGPQWLKEPSLGALWEKSEISGDIGKRPSFHSWSGKRNNIGVIEKRPSFSSWSGKRNNIGAIWKRPSFHSWSGKRDGPGEMEKRPSFHSWSGKRDGTGVVEKRPSFHSWSGKRDSVGDLDKRPSFHSWSGKRDGPWELEKRPSFHSWSGKRDSVGDLDKRPSFHSWSGKRDGPWELEKRPSFHSWSGKRDSVGDLDKRPSFHSWSGKRDGLGDLEKRPSFHSWSGKRGLSNDQDTGASSDLITWDAASNLWRSLPVLEATGSNRKQQEQDRSFHADNTEDSFQFTPFNVYTETKASEQEEQET